MSSERGPPLSFSLFETAENFRWTDRWKVRSLGASLCIKEILGLTLSFPPGKDARARPGLQSGRLRPAGEEPGVAGQVRPGRWAQPGPAGGGRALPLPVSPHSGKPQCSQPPPSRLGTWVPHHFYFPWPLPPCHSVPSPLLASFLSSWGPIRPFCGAAGETEAETARPAQAPELCLCPWHLSPITYLLLSLPLSLSPHTPSVPPSISAPTSSPQRTADSAQSSHLALPVPGPTCRLPGGVLRQCWPGSRILQLPPARPEPRAGPCQARPGLPLSQGNFREPQTRPTGLRSTPDRPSRLCAEAGMPGL